MKYTVTIRIKNKVDKSNKSITVRFDTERELMDILSRISEDYEYLKKGSLL